MTGNQMLVPLGREKAVMLSVSIGAVFDFVLNFFVIPKMGAAGAALSTLLTEFWFGGTDILFKGPSRQSHTRSKGIAHYLSAAVSTGAGIVIQHYMGVSNSFYGLSSVRFRSLEFICSASDLRKSSLRKALRLHLKS